MQTAVTQASHTVPGAGFERTLPGRIAIGFAATLVVAIAAHISLPLWFTPVPLTLQPLAVLGVGLALGPVTGFMVMVAYLLEGAMGMPVFSPAGPGGVAQIVGPTGGYLMCYPLIAFLVGSVTRGMEARMPRFFSALVGCTVAVAVLFVCGASWLMHMGHLSVQQAWIAGVAPFLPGEAIKVVSAAGLYSALARSARS